MKVIKRTGDIEDFNIVKIIKALEGANSGTLEMSNEAIGWLASSVDKAVNNKWTATVDVEDIQDAVESALMIRYPRTAKEYILYRQKHAQQRKATENLMKSFDDLLFKPAEDSDLKRDNANVNTDSPMGIMLKVGTEATKSYLNNYILDDKFRTMHTKHIQHIHDADFSLICPNCFYLDTAKVLEDGFNTGHGYVREPKSVRSAASLVCIALQCSQNNFFGGQSMVGLDFGLAKYVNLSFQKYLMETVDNWASIEDIYRNSDITKCPVDYQEEITDKELCMLGEMLGLAYVNTETMRKIHSIAVWKTQEETKQAMEALIHNLNTLHSRAGSQVPFSSINFGMDTSDAGRLVIKSVLDATWNGLGHGETPIFPISVFQLKSGVNYNPKDPNYDLFKYAMKVSAKRLFPNFLSLDSSFNKPYYKEGDYRTFVAAMGCRTRVVSNVNGPEHSASRGNFAFTTINLPYLALQAEREVGRTDALVDRFMELLTEQMKLGKKYLEWRYEIIANKHVYNFPFSMGEKLYMGSEHLRAQDTVHEALKNASLSIGFVGLAECLIVLVGKHHGESEEARELGLNIVRFMRAMTDRFTKETHMNWSCFASPAENFAGQALRGARKEFGVIPGVTDRDYFTNSFHVPVYYKIKAMDKIKIEGPYHSLCNAGAISYIEMDGDPLKNPKAFESLVRAMADNDMGYFSINHAVDHDPVCGYTGIIANECPCCHRKENEEVVELPRIKRKKV